MRSYVVITGANGGIGKALVAAFRAADYGVIASDITPQGADLDCDHFVQADLQQTVTNEACSEQIFSGIRQALDGQPLKGLVNNAAIQILGGVEELDRTAWQTTLNINLLAPFVWTQALLPELSKAEGCVVNIGSIHARLTKKNFVAYATSKAALAGLTRAMAVDLGEKVRVNAIEPAAIETEMLKAGFDGKPEQYAQLEQCHPQQRIGQPEEVAKLALAIIGGGMDFLHGACVNVDGGISGRLFDPD